MTHMSMELLLNLTWLLLVIPAYCVWRGSRTAGARKFSAAQSLFALACVLVILFPVISASDDLLAMRPEIEESPCGKRNIRQAHNDKGCGWNTRLQTPPALLASSEPFNFASELFEQQSRSSAFRAVVPIRRAGRAPPAADLI
jgi:hypothetical protein